MSKSMCGSGNSSGAIQREREKRDCGSIEWST